MPAYLELGKEGNLEVKSFSFINSRMVATPSTGSSGPASNLNNIKEIYLVLPMGPSSSKLMLSSVKGDTYAEGKLKIPAGWGKTMGPISFPFKRTTTLVFKNVYVANFAVNNKATEHSNVAITINFDSIQLVN